MRATYGCFDIIAMELGRSKDHVIKQIRNDPEEVRQQIYGSGLVSIPFILDRSICLQRGNAIYAKKDADFWSIMPKLFDIIYNSDRKRPLPEPMIKSNHMLEQRIKRSIISHMDDIAAEYFEEKGKFSEIGERLGSANVSRLKSYLSSITDSYIRDPALISSIFSNLKSGKQQSSLERCINSSLVSMASLSRRMDEKRIYAEDLEQELNMDREEILLDAGAAGLFQNFYSLLYPVPDESCRIPLDREEKTLDTLSWLDLNPVTSFTILNVGKQYGQIDIPLLLRSEYGERRLKVQHGNLRTANYFLDNLHSSEAWELFYDMSVLSRRDVLDDRAVLSLARMYLDDIESLLVSRLYSVAAAKCANESAYVWKNPGARFASKVICMGEDDCLSRSSQELQLLSGRSYLGTRIGKGSYHVCRQLTDYLEKRLDYLKKRTGE